MVVIDIQLRLPGLEPEPRQRGLTMVIDPGLFTGQFEDAVDSVGEFVDLVKFGWSTCNGTIPIDNTEKARWVARLADEFVVISEVGFKDIRRSDALAPVRWISFIEEDLAAGAHLVTAEARESGRSGICRTDGEPRHEWVEQILGSGIDLARLLFEAPNSDLQTYFLRRMGPSVNLGNVRADDVIALETLRRGLRSDTLLGVS